MPHVQENNSQNVDLLAATFQRKYDPMLARGQAISTLLTQQGCVGVWSGVVSRMNDLSGSVIMVDHGGQFHLTRVGAPLGTYRGLAPTMSFLSGTGDAYRYSDVAALDITGLESSYSTGNRGITIGGWFQNYSAPGTFAVIMGKTATGNTCNYRLQRTVTTGNIEFVIFDGTALRVASSVATPPADEWNFLAGRFLPGQSVSVWVDTEKVSNVTSIGASATTNAEPFLIGARSNGAGGYQDHWSGLASMVFLYACALHDNAVTEIYEQTRAMFGK